MEFQSIFGSYKISRTVANILIDPVFTISTKHYYVETSKEWKTPTKNNGLVSFNITQKSIS